MKKIFLLFLFFTSITQAQIGGVPIHCGYDFTSYFVVYPHESGKTETIDGLHIAITNAEGKEVININNSLSWINGNKPMVFTRNYKIDSNNQRLTDETEDGKWFYYFAQNHYLLAVSNTFPAEDYYIKIEDKENGKYKTQIIPLASYNMYVLCSAEERDKAVQFGRKMNKPIDVVMDDKK